MYRIQQVIDSAAESNRKLAIVGDSMKKVIEISQRLNYLRVPKGLIISVEEISKYNGEDVAVLCSGTQGEPVSALHRMAKGSDRQLSILPKDTVIISASPSPGNEKSIGRVVDYLYKLGAEVVHSDKRVNVSGMVAKKSSCLCSIS